MKTSNIIITALIALGIAGGAYYYTNSGTPEEGTKATAKAKGKGKSKPKPWAKAKKSTLPTAVASAVDAGDYEAAREALVSYLKDKGVSLTDEKSMAAAMLLEFIRETDAPILSAYAAEDKQKRKFLREFANDPEWQELYLGCGLVPFKTDIGINVLYRIWCEERGNVKNKKLAVALASVWGGGETAPNPALLKRNPANNDPVWRYKFFRKQAAKGALHPNYRNLQPWELRFTVGIPAQDWDDQSFTWAAENINIPWDRYGWACWAAVYTDPSKFGDSVQSGEYGLPFPMESAAESTHINGGVCGAMSHLGCYAAMAHGIPAYTVGQPGHCAYGYRLARGKWEGGFGGPDGGMHNHIFGNQAPDSFLLMEAVFGNDSKIEKAYRQSYCARALEATGDKAAAEKMWGETLKTAPLHPFFRKQLHRFMLEREADTKEVYDYLQEVIPQYRGQGFSAAKMVEDLTPIITKMDDKQKLAIYKDIHAAISTTPSSWANKPEQMFTKQIASLSSAESRERYLADVFIAHMKQGDGTVFGKALEWAVKEYVEKGDAETFGKAFAKAASGAKKVDTDSKEDEARLKSLRNSYNKALFATEQARSIPAFQQLSRAATKVCGEPPAPGELTKIGEMQGTPAEPNGLFRISTTSQYDAPYSHRSIMTPKGGQSHTAAEEKPNFIVELADANKTLSGCIIRKSNGSEHRMKKATVYTSSDGATWMEKAKTDNMPKEWVVQFPAGTQGKWVKVELDNTGGKNFAHISHFVIFVK